MNKQKTVGFASIILATAIATVFYVKYCCYKHIDLDSIRNRKVNNAIDSSSNTLNKFVAKKAGDNEGLLSKIYSAPVNVYGCVVDDMGYPLSNALVKYSLNDKFFKDGSKGTTTSDSRGNFFIQGKGASVYVQVQKKGYYRIPNKSYGTVRSDRLTSLQTPAQFVLKKAGPPQVLVHNVITTRRLPTDGTAAEIHLAKTKIGFVNSGHLRIEVWIEAANPQQYEGFEWKCRISVPGGGLAERTDNLHFEAPLEGYTPMIEFMMPASLGRERSWMNSIEKQFYLRLPDGTHARGLLYISFEPERALVSFDSFWNQSPTNSRNLEAGANEFGRAL